MSAISGITGSPIGSVLGGRQPRLFNKILECLEFHEVARSSVVSKSMQERAVAYLNSPEVRKRLGIPDGMRTEEHLGEHGVPTFDGAMKKLEALIASQDLRQAQGYVIDMPLDPGCGLWGTVGGEGSVDSRSVHPAPTTMVVTTRRKLRGQKQFCTDAEFFDSVYGGLNAVRTIARMAPLSPAQKREIEKSCSTCWANLGFWQVDRSHVSLPPVSRVISEEDLEILRSLRVTEGQHPNISNDMISPIYIADCLNEHMSPEDHRKLMYILHKKDWNCRQGWPSKSFKRIAESVKGRREEIANAEERRALIWQKRAIALQLICELGLYLLCDLIIWQFGLPRHAELFFLWVSAIALLRSVNSL